MTKNTATWLKNPRTTWADINPTTRVYCSDILAVVTRDTSLPTSTTSPCDRTERLASYLNGLHNRIQTMSDSSTIYLSSLAKPDTEATTYRAACNDQRIGKHISVSIVNPVLQFAHSERLAALSIRIAADLMGYRLGQAQTIAIKIPHDALTPALITAADNLTDYALIAQIIRR